MPASNKDEIIETGFTPLLDITTIKEDKTYKSLHNIEHQAIVISKLFFRDEK